MAEKTPLYIDVDPDSGQPTSLAAFSAGDVIPQGYGGTGGTSVSSVTGFIYNSNAGTLDPINDVSTLSIVGGSQKLIARYLSVGSTLSGGPGCAANFDGPVSSTHGVSALNVSGTNLLASTCPIPNPVCYAQMGGVGTAGSTEIKFGAGVTPATTTDSSQQIVWDNSNNEFDIAADGTYHVLATLVLSVGGSTLTTIRIKKGSDVMNLYAAHGVHSAEDPEEVTIQSVFTCDSGDSINVTFEDDGSTATNLERGSSVLVKRLF